MNKTIIGLAVFIALVFAALLFANNFLNDGNTPKVSPLQALAVGNMAKFSAHSQPKSLPDIPFIAPDGRQVTLAAFHGKVILLNIWATWCAPCRHEMPGLDRLNQTMKNQNFEVVILSMDRSGRDVVMKFLNEVGIQSLSPYLDPTGKFSRAAGALGLPVTLLINKEGKELGRLTGPAEWDSEDARALIRAALDPA
tara:strand:- start:6392 stop:6979 length:588 start_codon:yes stop_codon:yes gene_type:complete